MRQNKHPLRSVILIVVLTLITISPLTTPGQAPTAFAQVDTTSSPVAPLTPAATANTTDFVDVLVELTQPSAIEAYTAALADMGALDDMGVESASALAPDRTAQLAAVSQAQVLAAASQQEAFLASLDGFDYSLLYTAQRVYNGVALRVPASQIGALGALPGVAQVSPLLPKYPDHVTSVPFIGAPPLWQGAAGLPLTGEGVSIAIVDTGIDYLHTMFGGPGFGYDANDPARIGDVRGFPAFKIAGGYDFAGQTYNANPQSVDYQPIPEPDPDPIDCYSHGTHVAGTAAGYGVTSAGTTYAGPWTTDLPANAFRIGPGVAPQATLYALKVFGCAGPSAIVDRALEWAADPNQDGDFSDHVDVVNMSLGSSFGGNNDSTSRAANRISEIGVIVVASSGNSGRAYYVSGSPGTADRVISVAGTAIGSVAPGKAGGESDIFAGFSSRGPRRDDAMLKPDLAAPGVQIVSALNRSGTGAVSLSGTSMAAPHVAGAAALLRQLHPTWPPAEIKALLMNTAAPVVRSELDYAAPAASPAFAGAGRIDLAAAAQATTLAASSERPGTVSLSFGTPVAAHNFGMLQNLRVTNKAFTQQSYALFYEPINDMPGATITLEGPSTLALAAGETRNVGVRLDFDVAQFRNLRDPSTTLATNKESFWFGEENGLIWLWPQPSHFNATLAAFTSVSSAGAPNDVGAAHALALDANAAVKATYALTTATLSLTVQLAGAVGPQVTGIDIVRGPVGAISSLPVATIYEREAGSGLSSPMSHSVTLSAADQRLLAAGYLQVLIRTETHPSGELAGPLRATTPVLKTPVYAAPRAASQMNATSSLDFGASATASTTLAGATLTASATPTQTQALVSVLELHGRSKRAPVGQIPPTPGLIDLKYVGIGSDFAATGALDKSTLFVGVAMYEPWSTPNLVGVDIYIDTNQDNTPDYVVSQTSRSEAETLNSRDDRFVSTLHDIAKRTTTTLLPLNLAFPGERNTSAFDNDVMVLGVPVAKLGLTPGRSRLDLYVTTRTRNSNESAVGDYTNHLVYDVARPAITLTGAAVGSPLRKDTPGDVLTFTLDRAAWAGSTAKGMLLLHHHNEDGARAEEASVSFAWPHPIYFPIAAR